MQRSLTTTMQPRDRQNLTLRAQARAADNAPAMQILGTLGMITGLLLSWMLIVAL